MSRLVSIESLAYGLVAMAISRPDILEKVARNKPARETLKAWSPPTAIEITRQQKRALARSMRGRP